MEQEDLQQRRAEAIRRGRRGIEVAHMVPAARDLIEELEGEQMCQKVLAGKGEYPIEEDV